MSEIFVNQEQSEYGVPIYEVGVQTPQFGYFVKNPIQGGSITRPNGRQLILPQVDVLHVVGPELPDTPEASEFRVGFTGGRNISDKGKRSAYVVGQRMKEFGISIVNGMAEGFDTEILKGFRNTQTAQNSRIFGIAGMPINEFYPPANKDLIKAIAQEGYVVSMNIHGKNKSVVTKENPFIDRNSLILAMSDCLIVGEGGVSGGTHKTLDTAIALGKPVGMLVLDEYLEDSNSLYSYVVNNNLEDRVVLLKNREDIENWIISLKL